MATGLATAAAADEAVTVEVGDGISLKAEDVFLRQVVVELSERVPFTLVERGETLEQPVSFDFGATSWADAISALLRGAGYTLTTDAVTGQPKILVVDWGMVGESLGLVSSGSPADDDVEAKIRAVAAELLKPRDHAAEAIDAVTAMRQALREARQALLAAAGNDPGGVLLADAVAAAQADYDEALGNLGNHDDERAVSALLPALDEDDKGSRLSALEALRDQSRASKNPQAIERVAAAVEREDDPEVQRAALEVYVRYGDPEEVLSVIESIALTEGPNQDLAAREWLRIREEQETRARMEAEGDPQLRQIENQ